MNAPPFIAYGAPETTGCGMRLELLQLDSRFPFQSSRFEVSPGGSTPPDVHKVAEMWIVVEGMGELLYDQQSTGISAGDSVYFAPMRTHQIRNHGSQPLKVISLWWPGPCSISR
jgi:methionyl-tRNA synthetase